ncbi:hypothetical protein [Achromobacter xylosoxidans]|uniref:hypothetical protein n=1 Tax=Alcaligenes xylosoxydans xylosoxydans TaxID=85698 RepID=UPI001EEA7780|nr:hypothetical protein [Achromobacter xylosoxidans]
MDRNKKSTALRGDYLLEVKKLLLADGELNDAEVARRKWKLHLMDDKIIFDEDAQKLANAFKTQGASIFHAARVSDVISSKNVLIVYDFDATEAGVEAFQGEAYFEMNFDDCVFFNLPTTCVVLRPGDTDVTVFAGNAAFIGEMVD